MHKKEIKKLTSVHTRDEEKLKKHTTFFEKQFDMLEN